MTFKVNLYVPFWNKYTFKFLKNLLFQAKKVKENVKNKKAEHLFSTMEHESLGLIWYRLRLVELVTGFLALLFISLLSCGHYQELLRSWEHNALLQNQEKRVSNLPSQPLWQKQSIFHWEVGEWVSKKIKQLPVLKYSSQIKMLSFF